jgi:hypothetical protein
MGEPNNSDLNQIGSVEPTQGSEPSQYLKEKKTKVISLVAASESEEA